MKGPKNSAGVLLNWLNHLCLVTIYSSFFFLKKPTQKDTGGVTHLDI